MATEKSANRILDLILNQLEKLTENQDRLSKEIQETNIELTKISGFKNGVEELKTWKDGLSSVINADDLKNIKDFYTKNQDIDADIIDLYLITKELRADAEEFKKFKANVKTVIAVVSFLFTVAMTIIGWKMK